LRFFNPDRLKINGNSSNFGEVRDINTLDTKTDQTKTAERF